MPAEPHLAKCYELLEFLENSQQPVHRDNLPKHLAGDPFTICDGRDWIEWYNANVASKYPMAYLRKPKRYFDRARNKWMGVVAMTHVHSRTRAGLP